MAGYAVVKSPPQLIVCDVALPRIPVIFLTAQSTGTTRADEFLGAVKKHRPRVSLH